MLNEKYGILYIIATPIGNLGDISPRAVETLKNVDCILAEDTRVAKKLLQHVGVSTLVKSMHAFNEHEILSVSLQQLLAGNSIAVISDAGTPLISDPGFLLVSAAQKSNIKVTPIPGPSALIAALSASGLPADKFAFGGFLPNQQQARLDALRSASLNNATYIFYESTHRLMSAINDIEVVYGQETSWCLAKEITKIHEHFINGTTSTIRSWLHEDPKRINGEFVIVLPPGTIDIDEIQKTKILRILLEELPINKATKVAAKILDVSKNDLYKLALTLSKDRPE